MSTPVAETAPSLSDAVRENRIGCWRIYHGQLYAYPGATAALLAQTLIVACSYDAASRALVYTGYHPRFEIPPPIEYAPIRNYAVVYGPDGPEGFVWAGDWRPRPAPPGATGTGSAGDSPPAA